MKLIVTVKNFSAFSDQCRKRYFHNDNLLKVLHDYNDSDIMNNAITEQQLECMTILNIYSKGTF